MFTIVPTFILTMWFVPMPCLRRLNSLRIIHGTEDVQGKYPFVVALIELATHRVCTGTLLTSEWVLTAGHCALSSSHIQYGNMSVTPLMSHSMSPIVQMVRHPHYIPQISLTNDIALLRVHPVPMKKYGKLSAVDYKVLLGYEVEYAGFGVTQKRIPGQMNLQTRIQDNNRLLRIGTGVLTSCEHMLSDHGTIVSVGPNVCVNPKCSNKNQVANHGDSGGPLFCQNKIIGVAAWVSAGYTIPSTAYTVVSPYLDWIYETINNAPPLEEVLTKLVP